MISARISGRLWKLPGTEPAAITASLPLEQLGFSPLLR